jgi:nucleoside-diphosphate kinase
MKHKELTLAYIKPRAFMRRDAIFEMIRKAGFEIIQTSEEVSLPKEVWEALYAEHKDKPFFESLVGFSSSGPIVAAILEKEDAIADFRILIGATDPAKAAIGTIRNLYGNKKLYADGVPANAIHGSDSVESARREIALFFPDFDPTEKKETLVPAPPFIL